jgi:DNA-binding NtrC family response regulator
MMHYYVADYMASVQNTCMSIKTAKERPRVLALPVAGDTAAFQKVAAAAGVELVVASTLRELLGRLDERPWAATFVSFSVKPMDDRVAARIGEHANCGALVLTAPAVTLERALAMERSGAVALLREPLDPGELGSRLRGTLDEGREVPIAPPDPEVGDADPPPPVLVGDSAPMASVFETVARVAGSNATVLVTGESGTGKEVVARALHWASDRRRGPFVPVNCAAIPEHLLESELFGHERGAFTGAVARRVGRFERAHGGTLFLDEVGDMSLVLQAKVLRALEERTVERVGGEEARAIDVRVVAATNQDLAAAIGEGRFREDLYYRLAVVELHMPPLRERGSDVRALALHFAGQFARSHRKPVTAITGRALRRLQDADWPGNVRELRNVMDRAVLLCTGGTIRAGDLRVGVAAPTTAARGPSGADVGYAATLSLEEVEADHLRRVLASVGGHIAKTASVLGIHRNTLTRKMRQYGIDPPSAP